MEEKKDLQARAYQLTINNPIEKGMTHDEIKRILGGIPHMTYWCLADEKGEAFHTHIYFSTKNPLKFSTVKNRFTTAHIEKTQGTAQQNREYIRKEGVWKETEKAETSFPESFEEWGVLPVSQKGKRTDLEYLYDLVKDGMKTADILDLCAGTAIPHLDKIDKLRGIYLSDKFKSIRRLDLRVHYITGETGTGKSRDILDEFGDENVFRVTDYTHPFDKYQLEPVIVFEEFRSGLRISDMLNYLDIYPVTLPARYNPKVGCYTTVFVVSNYEFEQQYPELQKDPEMQSTYEAWVRRFNGIVKEYSKNGIKVYNTLQEYLKRKFVFHQVVEPTPFDETKNQQIEIDYGMPFN